MFFDRQNFGDPTTCAFILLVLSYLLRFLNNIFGPWYGLRSDGWNQIDVDLSNGDYGHHDLNINGGDPNFTVIAIELLVRFRRSEVKRKEVRSIFMSIIDSFRMGFIYGLFMEGFKLL